MTVHWVVSHYKLGWRWKMAPKRLRNQRRGCILDIIRREFLIALYTDSLGGISTVPEGVQFHLILAMITTDRGTTSSTVVPTAEIKRRLALRVFTMQHFVEFRASFHCGMVNILAQFFPQQMNMCAVF
jgi:hypothetical protein